MNILTKISVVVMFVLILFFSIAAISLATVVPNWKARAMEKANQADLASVALRQETLATRRAQLDADEQRKRADVADGKIRTVETTMQASLQAQTLDNAQNKALLASNVAQLAQLQQNLDAVLKRNEALSDEIKAARGEINKKEDELRTATDTNNQRQLDVEKFQKLNDHLQEQIAELKTEIERLGKGGTAANVVDRGAASAAGAVEPETKISGTITLVRNELASINVGSAQGARKGMKLMVYRDSKFVAYLQIQDVDVNSAGGLIVSKQAEPQVGDKVESVK